MSVNETAMNVNITGASGFVGTNLIRYLTNLKINVKPLSRSILHDTLFFSKGDVVVHLAGKAHDLKETSNPDEYYKVNFELTKKIYDTFLKSEAEMFIFISSVKAAADVVDGVLTEEMKASPQTHYGKSKLMAEEYIQKQILPEGKLYYILRPCMIHGPGNKGNLNLLYKFIQKGVPYPLGAFENKRSFLSVENLCFVIANLIKKKISSGIYQVADDDALSTNEIVSILAEAEGKKARVWKVSPVLLRLLAGIGDRIHLPLTTERLNKLTEDYIVSNDKIKKAIQISLPLATKEGLRITAASFKKR